MRVPLGVGGIQSASLRLCHEVGVPVAEVLLLRGERGVWTGVIDGRLLRAPRVGLWVRVQKGGVYRGVLGSVDDPVWIDVAEQALNVRSSEQRGGAGLTQLRASNKRPAFGFPDYSPASELPMLLDQAGDRFVRNRWDGRVVRVQKGRIADRFEHLELDGLDLMDPYDGSIVDWVYVSPGSRVERRVEALSLARHGDHGTSGWLAGGLPGRAAANLMHRFGAHRLAIDGLVDVLPSGGEVFEDHSSGLPSYHDNRQVDDRGRGALVSWVSRLDAKTRASVGLMHRSDAGGMGLWDTLAHGEWRQRYAALLALSRRADSAAKTRLSASVKGGLWQHDDRREIAGGGLVLRDADADGLPERFPDGVLFSSKQTVWNGAANIEFSQGFGLLRAGLRLNGEGAGLLGGEVLVNRGESGVTLGSLLSHPIVGDREGYADGFAQAELLAELKTGPWRGLGRFGGVAAVGSSRPWSGLLALSHQRVGRHMALRVFSQPQRHLLDRHVGVEGYLAQGLSDSIPFGAALLDADGQLPAPFKEGIRFDIEVRKSRGAGVWRYGLDLGADALWHSADGADRSGNSTEFDDDGQVRSLWASGRMDFVAYSGLRFHGSLWWGKSYAQRIDSRAVGPPALDQPWVLLSEVPNWRWRNSITQVIARRWMTGGTLTAISAMSASDRTSLATLHGFRIPPQLRVDAWLRYQLDRFAVVLRGDNLMQSALLDTVPRPDRVPGLLPVSPRRVMVELEWRPNGRPGSPEAYR